MNGWIRLYRELLDKPIWVNSTLEQRVILITLLCMANHEPKKWEWQGKPYEVTAGQFITSIASIVEKCRCKSITHKKVRTALERFEKLEFLARETASQNTLITIVNWYIYQEYNIDKGKQEGKPRANEGQTEGKRRATNKNDKNDKNERSILTISNDIVCRTKVQQADMQAVFDKWNGLESFGIKGIKTLSSTSKRYNSMMARIKEHGIDNVLGAIEKVKGSKFLRGYNNKGWVITFDWFVKPNNFVKVLEGNYDDRDSAKKQENKANSALQGRCHNIVL